MVCVACGQPDFSRSAEHGDVGLCFKHYKAWLASEKKTKVEDLK